MANKELISELVSEAAFNQIEGRLVKALELANDKIVTAIISVEKFNVAIAKSGTLKELTTQTKSYNDEVLKLQKSQQQVIILEERKKQAIIKTQTLEQKRIADEEKNEARREVIAQKEVDRENARIVRESKKGKAIISNSQLEIDAYNNTVNGSKKVTSTINDQNKALADASSKAAAYSSATKKVAVETLKVAPAAIAAQKSILQLKIQLESYKAISEKATDPKILTLFNAKAEETEATISRLSNVGKKGFDELGNAVGKSTNFATKAFGALRNVANILPGIGIYGILAFATEPIMEYIKGLDLFKAKVDQAKESKKQFNAVNVKGAQDAQLEITQLKTLYDTSKNIVLTTDQRYNAAKKLQEQYPQTFKNYTVEQIELGKVDAGYLKLTESILATARARASQDKIAENSSRQLQNEQTINDALIEYDKQKLISRKALAKMKDPAYSTAARGLADEAARAEERQAAAAKIIREAKKDSLILDQRNLKLTENITAQQVKGAELADPNKLKKGKTEKDLKVDTSEFDAQRERVERTKSVSKEIVDDEKDSFETRLQALDIFNNQAAELVNIDFNRSVKKAKGNADQIKFLEEKRLTDLQDIEINGRKLSFKLFTDQLNEEQKERLRINQQELSAINDEEAIKLDAINISFANRLVSEKEYGDLRQNIQREYIQKYIEAEIKQVQDLLEVASLSTDQRAEYEKKLSDLKLKLSREVTKNQIDDNKSITKSEEDNAKKRAEIDKQLADKKKDLQKEVFDLGVAIINGSFEREQNKVQDEIDLREKRKQSDIEDVNNSLLTEQEKADKIKIIEAQSLANKEVLEQKQRDIEKRKAQFQKVMAVAEVGINTAKDVAKVSTGAAVLSLTPVVGPILAAAALAQIPWMVGIGATQIAAILAMPAFQDGGVMAKSGPALFGEVGTELRIDPSGQLSLTPDKPTVGYVEAGTQFISNADLVRMTAKPELNPVLSNQYVDVSGIIAEQRSSTKQIIKAYSSQKSYNTSITKSGWRNTQSGMDKIDKYLKRNFK